MLTQLTSTALDRASSGLAARTAGLVRKAWHGYWDWRARQATVIILRSLDRRTLHDIGINPSEIESFVYDERCERRRRYHENWHQCRK